MYSPDQELAFATQKIKHQRAYIRQLEDANTPEINALKSRIAALEAIIAAAPHEEQCGSWDGACDCWKSKAEERSHG